MGFLNKFKVNKGSVFVDVAVFSGKHRDTGKDRFQNYSCFVDLSLLQHWKEILEIGGLVFGNGDEIIKHYQSKVLVLTIANPFFIYHDGFINGEGILKMVEFPD